MLPSFSTVTMEMNPPPRKIDVANPFARLMDELFERQWDNVEAGGDSFEDFGRKGSQQMVRRGGEGSPNAVA
jgi:hypothetical protein